MEYNWSPINNSIRNTSSSTRGQNGNFSPSHAWEYSPWDLPDYYSSPPPPAAAFQSAMLREQEAGTSGGGGNSSSSTITSATTIHCNPDPQLTCLKLGKRHYFGDLSPPTPPPPSAVMMRRGRGGEGASAPTPRCQVEGCEAALANAKDYHRRHKVCETHAKAPKVVLGGIHQRFCQQCSRFHSVGEFDEAKRSCRRRLAGHNERRRKSSQDHTCSARKQYYDIKMVGAGRHPQPHIVNSSGCALSLLSPASYGPWNAGPAPDLPARCSAALRELITENRASAFACRQLGPCWSEPENRGHVTLNLMHGPDSAFGLIADRPSEEDGAGDCSDLWKLPLGY